MEGSKCCYRLAPNALSFPEMAVSSLGIGLIRRSVFVLIFASFARMARSRHLLFTNSLATGVLTIIERRFT